MYTKDMKLYFIFKEEIANCSSRPPISVIKKFQITSSP